MITQSPRLFLFCKNMGDNMDCFPNSWTPMRATSSNQIVNRVLGNFLDIIFHLNLYLLLFSLMPLWFNHLHPLFFKLFFPCFFRSNVKLACKLCRVSTTYFKHHQISNIECSAPILCIKLASHLMSDSCGDPIFTGFRQKRCEILRCKALKLVSVQVELFSLVHRQIS